MRLPSAKGPGTLLCILSGSMLLTALLGGTFTKSQTAPKAGEPLITSVKGPELFHAYCAACHGTNGRGDGPTASSLKAKVPDLTMLAKYNKGQYPAARVRKVIEGLEVVQSHGSRQMPIWGPIFHQVEEDQDYGSVRIENLVKYLESIQQK